MHGSQTAPIEMRYTDMSVVKRPLATSFTTAGSPSYTDTASAAKATLVAAETGHAHMDTAESTCNLQHFNHL